jgi:hypothetical protein
VWVGFEECIGLLRISLGEGRYLKRCRRSGDMGRNRKLQVALTLLHRYPPTSTSKRTASSPSTTPRPSTSSTPESTPTEPKHPADVVLAALAFRFVPSSLPSHPLFAASHPSLHNLRTVSLASLALMMMSCTDGTLWSSTRKLPLRSQTCLLAHVMKHEDEANLLHDVMTDER